MTTPAESSLREERPMKMKAPCPTLLMCLVSFVALTSSPAQASTTATLFEQGLVVNLAGEEVGTMEARDTRDGENETLRRTAAFTIRRGSTVTTLKTRTVVQLVKGAPAHYRFEKEDPGGTLVIEGEVAKNRRSIELTSTQNGAVVHNTVGLPDGWTFALAVEHKVRQGLRPGLSISGPTLLEELGAVVEMSTSVKGVDGGRFEVTSSFQGVVTTETMDAKGRTLVARTPAVGLVAYPPGRAPDDVVAMMASGKKADLLAVSQWKVSAVRPGVKRVVYRITTPDAATFVVPEDARQKVLKRTATAVDVEVRAGPSTTTTLTGAARAKALSATPYEAVDDPRIKKVARATIAGATSDEERVKRLSHFVFKHVKTKGLDRGYAPAVATLESQTGDCTEHSVLLSALLRAVGIPTRIIDGVIVDGTQAGYHEWVEVDLGKGFIAVDPTFDAWPAGPERLKLAEGSTLPDEQLGLSLAASRLLKHGVKLEVLSSE